MKPYDAFLFRAYPCRWIAVWVCWNMGTLLERLGALTSRFGKKLEDRI